MGESNGIARDFTRAFNEILGDEGKRILEDVSFSPTHVTDLAKFEEVELIATMKGCFTGVVLALADIKYMMRRWDAMNQELLSRRGVNVELPMVGSRKKKNEIV